jgi:hypothetical protein
VPTPQTVAAGSGPHDDAPAAFRLPSGPAEIERAWNEVLHALDVHSKVLWGVFHAARVMRWTADLLELGFPIDVDIAGEMAQDKAEDLAAILRTLGPELARIKVAVRLLDASESSATQARSVVETTRERTSAERNRREAEAREHPITKHVLQTFGAQIKEIKTDV